MIEHFKHVVKVIDILRGFEDYRSSRGYTSKLKSFDYHRKKYDCTYTGNELKILVNEKHFIRIRTFLLRDRERTLISSNRFTTATSWANIQFDDDFLRVADSVFGSHEFEVKDLIEPDFHFQQSLIADIPSTEYLKEVNEVFELLMDNQIAYIGSLNDLDFDLYDFLRFMAVETSFVKEYWDNVDI